MSDNDDILKSYVWPSGKKLPGVRDCRDVRCTRRACQLEIPLYAACWHRDTMQPYCGSCARAINRACNETVVKIPTLNVKGPPMQMVPRRLREAPVYDASSAGPGHIALVEPVEQCLDCGCEHPHHCPGVPGGFSEDEP